MHQFELSSAATIGCIPGLERSRQQRTPRTGRAEGAQGSVAERARALPGNMASPLAMVSEITKQSARELRGGERILREDAVALVAPAPDESMVLHMIRSIAIDIRELRGGKPVPCEFDFDPRTVKDKKQTRPSVGRSDARRASRPKTAPDAGLLSGAFERTPVNAFPRSISHSPEKKAERVKKTSARAGRNAPMSSECKSEQKEKKSRRPSSSRPASPIKKSETKRKEAKKSKSSKLSEAPSLQDRKKDSKKSKTQSKATPKPSSSAKATPEMSKRPSVNLRSTPTPLRSVPQTPVDVVEPRETRASGTNKAAASHGRRDSAPPTKERSSKKRDQNLSKAEDAGGKSIKTERKDRVKPKKEIKEGAADKTRKRYSRDEADESPAKKRRSLSSQEPDTQPHKPSRRGSEVEPIRKESLIETPGKKTSSALKPTVSPRDGEGSSSRRSDVRRVGGAPILRSSRPGASSASNIPQSSNWRVGSYFPMQKRLPAADAMFDKFNRRKEECKTLWAARPRDLDKFEVAVHETMVLCFDWALAREEMMRRKSAELRRDRRKREKEKKNLRDHYIYMLRRLIPNSIEQLEEVNRLRYVPFCRMTARKIKLRLFGLSRVYEDEEEKRAREIKAILDELHDANKGEATIDLTLKNSELVQMRSHMTEYCNLMRLIDGVVADDLDPQEPGNECFIQ